MFANYHSHTYLCGHATGTQEEYIKRAIEGGLKIFGFSDHIPYMFPDGFESGHRAKLKSVEEYFKVSNELKEKYKNSIEIHVGYEMEYYPDHFDKMLKNAADWGTEYLILGQHFLGNEHPGGKYCGSVNDNIDHLKEYVSTVCDGMETGVFTYLAHPDVFQFVGDDKIYREEMSKICKKCVETDTPVEINFLGIRDNRHYPKTTFWELVSEYGCKVIFGIDSHSAESAWDPDSLLVAEKMVRDMNLYLIEKADLKSLK